MCGIRSRHFTLTCMWVWFWSWWLWGLKVFKKRQILGFFRICWPARSSSLFGRFYFMHSLRSKFLYLSIKKNHKCILKTKKVRATFWKKIEKNEIFDFSKIFMIFENFDFFENVHWKPQRKFSISKIFGKIMKIFKIFKNLIFSKIFRKVSLTFFVFKKKCLFFL